MSLLNNLMHRRYNYFSEPYARYMKAFEQEEFEEILDESFKKLILVVKCCDTLGHFVNKAVMEDVTLADSVKIVLKSFIEKFEQKSAHLIFAHIKAMLDIRRYNSRQLSVELFRAFINRLKTNVQLLVTSPLVLTETIDLVIQDVVREISTTFDSHLSVDRRLFAKFS